MARFPGDVKESRKGNNSTKGNKTQNMGERRRALLAKRNRYEHLLGCVESLILPCNDRPGPFKATNGLNEMQLRTKLLRLIANPFVSYTKCTGDISDITFLILKYLVYFYYSNLHSGSHLQFRGFLVLPTWV